MNRALCLLSVVPLLFSVTGCGDAPPPRKELQKVSGTILIDGRPPGSPVQIQCHNVAGMDNAMPTISQGLTDVLGNFELSTYESGDGIPPGDYVLTFTWKAFNAISNSFGGPDQLNGRYEDKDKSTIKVTVGSNPVDLSTIELTTKGEEKSE